MEFFAEFFENFKHNLFKPLLLFFYMGFSVPILKVPFEFPHVIYQGLTMYLLIAIGWKGGEELAELSGRELGEALGFMGVGFITNFIIGIVAYLVLRGGTRLRKIDAATVSAYYGSDSAGTCVTCAGVLSAMYITTKNLDYKPAAFMPVMLAVMEIPGCLVGLFLVSRLRRTGMDALGNMPGEPNYDPKHVRIPDAHSAPQHGEHSPKSHSNDAADKSGLASFINLELLHEIFLNPGLFLLFGGIVVGCISRFQGASVTKDDDEVFLRLFHGLLCLFLLEMGITACRRLRDLRTAGLPFILFALIAPNVFAISGIFVANAYSHAIGVPFTVGTYAMFAVLCGAASYIAVPAVQRLAIPEASPTLPLAASLGLTFSYNVTIGIPIYIQVAKAVNEHFPVVEAATAMLR